MKFKITPLIIITLSYILFLIFYFNIKNKNNPLTNFYNKKVIVKGKVIDFQKKSRKYDKILFEIKKINRFNVKSKIYIFVNKRFHFHKGEVLDLRLKIKQAKGSSNFGEFNFAEYYSRFNIYGYSYLKNSNQIIKRERDFLFSLFYFGEIVRNDIKKFLKQNYFYHQRGFLNAVILGDKRLLSKKIKDIFVNTGTIHILAISGLHIGIIVLIFLILFRIIGVKKNISLIIILFIIIFYNFIVGYRASIVRATLMFASMIILNLFDRDKNYINAIALSALIILIVRPYDIFSLSFQLSFLATLGVVIFTPVFYSFFQGFITIRIFLYVAEIISASIASQIFLVPLLIHTFHKFSYISVITNIIAIPLITIIIFLTILTYLLFHLFPFLSFFFSLFNNTLISILIYLLYLFRNIKMLTFPNLTINSIIIYYCTILTLFLPLKKYIKSVIVMCGMIMFIFTIFYQNSSDISLKNVNNDMEIIIFNIKGNSILIKNFNNKYILIDGGYYNDMKKHILPFLKKNGVKNIKAVFTTSYLRKRSEGMVELLKNMRVENYIDSGYFSDTLRYQRIMELISDKIKYIIMDKKELRFDNLKIRKLSPFNKFFKNYDKNKEEKENSIVLKIIYKKFSLLLLSDIYNREAKYLTQLKAEELDSRIIDISSLNFFREFKRILTFTAPKLSIINKKFTFFEHKKKNNIKNILTNYKIKSIFTEDKGAVKIIVNKRGYYRIITSR